MFFPIKKVVGIVRNSRRGSALGGRGRLSGLMAGAVVVSAIGSGCARVDPAPNFEQAGSDIRNRLGVQDVYNPIGESLIDDKVRTFLADGLTIEEAVSVAMLNNRAFQALFQSIGASQADVVQSRLLTNPSLVIGARFPDGGGRSELTLGLAQQLADLWQIPVRRQIAEAQLQQTVFSVLDEAVRIAARTKSACFDVLWRAQLEEIARQNSERARQSLALADARLRAGEANPLEAGLVRTQVLDTENESRRATRDLQNSRLALAQILGLARWPDSWNLSGELDSVDPVVAPEDDLIATAMANRFDIQWADARVASAERDIDLQLLRIFPSLEIGLQGERTERRALPGRKVLADTARASIAAGAPTAPTIESKGQRDLVRRQIIDSMLGPTLQLTLPIWDQNQAQIAKAGFTLQRISKEREQLLDSVVTDVRTAANNARIAAELVSSFRDEILPQVVGNLKSAESRYENGEESVLILLDAQEAEFVQKRLSADALRDYRTAIAELTGALGGRLESVRGPSSAPEADVSNHEEVSSGND